MFSHRFYFLRIPLCLQLLLVLPAIQATAADQASLLWKKANDHYCQKHYDSAVVLYQQIASTGKISATLFYNTGNAYYRLHKIGPAILYYEKALRLDPDNKLIKDNLLLAKKRIDNPVSEITPVFFERWWSILLHLFTINGWSILLLLFFCISIILIYFTVRKKLPYAGRWIACSVILLTATATITFFSYRDHTDSGKAVVTAAANTPLLEMPKPGARISVQVPEGTTVKIVRSGNNYVNIELPNGRQGWVDGSSLRKI